MESKGKPDTDILVVDDDISIRDVLKGRLAAAGYRTVAVANGRAALEFLHVAGCRLIITDLFMPEADGIEVLLAVKSRGLPVITMTGSMSFDPGLFQRVAVQFGACESLLKPFAIEDLLKAVRAAIGDPRPANRGNGG